MPSSRRFECRSNILLLAQSARLRDTLRLLSRIRVTDAIQRFPETCSYEQPGSNSGSCEAEAISQMLYAADLVATVGFVGVIYYNQKGNARQWSYQIFKLLIRCLTVSERNTEPSYVPSRYPDPAVHTPRKA